MTAGRETDHPNLVWIDMIFIGVLADPLKRPLRIGDHVGMLLSTEHPAVTGHEIGKPSGTVMQHKS